jgi:hypothetical protein
MLAHGDYQMTPNQRRQKVAQKQLRTKLKLEKTLERRMRKFFAKQNRNFKSWWNQIGVIYNADLMIDELEKILSDHYKRTAGKFLPNVFDEINRALKGGGLSSMSSSEKAAIASAVALLASRESRASARVITDTSNRIMKTTMQLNDYDPVPAQVQIRNKNISRSKTIAMTETQKASEGTKQKASEKAEDVITGGVIGRQILRAKKQWLTRQDKRVRPAHRDADGQIRYLNEPYNVKGQDLMYPGDSSFGATPDNYINCRCNSVQFFVIRKR